MVEELLYNMAAEMALRYVFGSKNPVTLNALDLMISCDESPRPILLAVVAVNYCNVPSGLPGGAGR
jgi:hypothetical protein